ncbi:MAG: CvpA family protein [Pirellulales bacterium]|nr:CvpA family protein [Pirellulales bacterium]
MLEYTLSFLLLLIFLGVVASLYPEGMWGNAITLINVVTAGLVATNYFGPLSVWLDDMNDWTQSCTYLWDFLMLWAVFALTMIVLRILTDAISKVKVRFLKIADRIGSGFFACLVGLVMVCFTLFSLHTAPLARNFLWEGFKPGEPMFFNFASPDEAWLPFCKYVSNNAYSTSEENEFDQQGFVNFYDKRRSEIEKHVTTTESIRTRN